MADWNTLIEQSKTPLKKNSKIIWPLIFAINICCIQPQMAWREMANVWILALASRSLKVWLYSCIHNHFQLCLFGVFIRPYLYNQLLNMKLVNKDTLPYTFFTMFTIINHDWYSCILGGPKLQKTSSLKLGWLQIHIQTPSDSWSDN